MCSNESYLLNCPVARISSFWHIVSKELGLASVGGRWLGNFPKGPQVHLDHPQSPVSPENGKIVRSHDLFSYVLFCSTCA